MAFRGFFVDWSSRDTDALGIEVSGLPDEILDQIPLVLGEQQVFRLLDDLSDIGNELSAFTGQFGGWVRERPRRQEAVQGDINLFVL